MKNSVNYKAIIPISGGIDSVALVYNTLKSNPDNQYLLLHIYLKNGESQDRCELELTATRNAIDYFQHNNLSNFDYKEAVLDYESAGEIPPVWDIEAVNFLVGTYMRGVKINIYIKATNKEDFAQENFTERLDNSMRILENTVFPDIESIQVLYPQKEMTKSEVMNSMPSELLQLCWYCRTPINSKPCGKCDTCVSVHKCHKL